MAEGRQVELGPIATIQCVMSVPWSRVVMEEAEERG